MVGVNGFVSVFLLLALLLSGCQPVQSVVYPNCSRQRLKPG